MTKRIFSLLIAVVIIVSALPMNIARADDNIDTIPDGIPSSESYHTDRFIVVQSNNRVDYFQDYALDVSSNATGRISIKLDVDAIYSMQKLGFTALSVQHWNGSAWEDVWTINNQFSTDTDSFSYIKTVTNLTSNDFYRVSANLYAKKGFLQVQTLTIVSYYISCL